MFPTEFADCDAAETLARVEAAHERQLRCELDLILLAQHYAFLHPDPTHGRGLPGGERTRVYGGEGCPEIAEFAPAEFGAVTGVSAGSAARFLGQCVALPFRFPLTWHRVKTGRATPWKARQIAQDCITLSQEAAAIVDRRVADLIDTVTGQQLANIKKAAIWEADPEAARAKAEEQARERGVWIGRTDNHGTTTLFVKAATGDIIALNATITQLAEALAATGDPDTLDHRRAKAAGLLSDPDLAADLLAAAQHLATTPTPATPNPTPATCNPTTVTCGPAAAAETTDRTGRDPQGAADEPNSPYDRETTATPCGPVDGMPTRGDVTEPSSTPAATGTPTAHQPDEPHPAVQPEPHTDQSWLSRPEPEFDHGWLVPPELDSDEGWRVPAEVDSDEGWLVPPAPDSDQSRIARPEPNFDEDWLVRLEPDCDEDWPTPPEPEPEVEADQDRRLQPLDELSDEPPGQPRPAPPAVDDSAQAVEPADQPARTGMDAAARRELLRRIDAVRRDHPDLRGRRVFQTVLTIHITDETLLAGQGTARVEGYGPVYTHQLTELLGYHRIVVRPVNDLNTPISVHSYEIPDRIRDQINLRYPVEQFPYGTGETTNTTDLDHIQPYRPNDPTPQTNTDNLTPLRRYSHRLKTHGDWKVRRLNPTTLEWTSPHGYTFHVNHTGTHHTPNRQDRHRTPGG